MNRYARVGETEVGDVVTIDEAGALASNGAIVGARWRVSGVNPYRLELLTNHASTDCASHGCGLKHIWSPVFKDIRVIVH